MLLDCSFVHSVKDLLLSSEASVGDLKFGLVEWLFLVEVVAVGRAIHV